MAKNEASRQGLTQEKIDEVDSQLIRRHATGESARYIAEALHLTVCQVQYRIKQLRAEGRIAPSEPPRGWTQEEMAALMARFSAACEVIKEATGYGR